MKIDKARTYESHCLGLRFKLNSNRLWFFSLCIIGIISINCIMLYVATMLTMNAANQIIPMLWPNYPIIEYVPALVFVAVADVMINGTYWLVLLAAYLILTARFYGIF